MKISEALELLTEAIILPVREAPDWVKDVFKKIGWTIQTIQVNATQKANLHKHYDYDAMTMYILSNGKVIEKDIDTMKQMVAVSRGIDLTLWDDIAPGHPNMVLVTHAYGGKKMAELFAHPNQMPKQIENKESGLTDDEKKFLLITKAYTSAYRPEEFKRYKINKNLQEIKESLIKKELLTASGALNIKGKNEVEKLTEGGAASSTLAKLFGYGD